MRLRNIVILAGAAGMAGSTATLANGLFSNGTFTVGGGAFYSSGTYKTEKSEVSAFPFVAYDSDRLHLGFDGIAYKFVNRADLEFSVRVAPGEKPNFPENKPLFAGLKRGTPVDVGFDAAFRFDAFYVSGSAMVDVSSEHKGYHATAKVGTELALGSVGIDVGAGVRLRDGKLNNFLYGVSAAEANASRAAYSVGSTAEPFVDMTLSYAVSESVALIGSMEYQFVDKKVQNSPLTNNKDSYGVGLGLIYSF